MIRMRHLELAIRAKVLNTGGRINTMQGYISQENKCCIACKYFEPLEERDEDGVCNELVSNDLSGQYIIGSDTFYCSLYLGIHYGL